ncbi:MAG: hypothetical protein ACOCVH_01785 [Verrucomicrobiota bacterium]
MNYRSTIIAATILISTVWASHAYEPTWLPGGDDVKAAVSARRGKTELSKLALSMKPGTWATLKVEKSTAEDEVITREDWPGHQLVIPHRHVFKSPLLDGGRNNKGLGGLHIAGWSDNAFWDSRTGQLLYMGLRQTRRFVAFSEEANAWRTMDIDPLSDNPVWFQKFGHIYGTSGFDPERSRFYHTYRDFKNSKFDLDLKGGFSWYDVVSGKWTKLPPSIGGSMSVEYFTAMDGLVVLRKEMVFFSHERQAWEKMNNGESPVDGYHSLFRHNPMLQEVLMAGGNRSPKVVARLTKEGKIERLKNFPGKSLSIKLDHVMIDPASGRYLICDAVKEGKKTIRNLYEFDSRTNQYRLVPPFTEGWPFGKYGMPVSASIPEYGVTIWGEGGNIHLYKHDASADYPVVEPETKAGE